MKVFRIFHDLLLCKVWGICGLGMLGACSLSAQSSSLGDVNGDGRIDYEDVNQVIRFDVGLDMAPEADIDCGDVSSDGKVNTLDALLLSAYLESLSTGSYDLFEGTCGLGIDVFPTQNKAGVQSLITSQVPLLGDIEVLIDGLSAQIDTIVPTRDSLVITVPTGVSLGNVDLEVKATELDLSETTSYQILSVAAYANLPAAPPIYFFPSSGLVLPLSVTLEENDYTYFVNVYNPDHTIKIRYGQGLFPDFITESDERLLDSSGTTFISLIQLNGSYLWPTQPSTCPSITYVDTFVVQRAGNHPYAGDTVYTARMVSIKDFAYPAGFSISLIDDLTCSELSYPSDNYATKNFLLLTSKSTGRQLLFCEVREIFSSPFCQLNQGTIQLFPNSGQSGATITLVADRPFGKDVELRLDCEVGTPLVIKSIGSTQDTLTFMAPLLPQGTGGTKTIVLTSETFYGEATFTIN